MVTFACYPKSWKLNDWVGDQLQRVYMPEGVSKSECDSFIIEACTGDELRKEPKAVEGLVDVSISHNCKEF